VRDGNERASQITKGDLAVPPRDSLVSAWRRFFRATHAVHRVRGVTQFGIPLLSIASPVESFSFLRFSETRFGFRITTLVLPESLVTHELTLARSLLFSDHCRRKNFLAAILFQLPGRVSLPILVDDCLLLGPPAGCTFLRPVVNQANQGRLSQPSWWGRRLWATTVHPARWCGWLRTSAIHPAWRGWWLWATSVCHLYLSVLGCQAQTHCARQHQRYQGGYC